VSPAASDPALNIASLGQRLLAGVINAAIMIAAVPAAYVIAKRIDRLFPAVLPALRTRINSRLTAPGKPATRAGRLEGWPRTLWIASTIGTVVARNWRSPGRRIVRIRRVEARTGGPVTVRSAAIRLAATEGSRRVNNWWSGPRRRRAMQRMDDLQPGLKDIQRAHRDDPEALERAMMDFHKAHDVNPLRACLPLVPGMLLLSLPALLSRRRQTAIEWLAGTVVVRDPGACRSPD
jgi:uncharacterized RDD family membrane protein YckC